MTPFTDDDLKLLKAASQENTNGEDWCDELSQAQLQALLARLEAAEKVCRSLDKKGWVEATDKTLEAWRKSKGE